MDDTHRILGVHITDRIERAQDVQATLTAYGCNIKTRVGLHHVHGEYCSPHGLLLLELHGDEKECDAMKAKLESITGVQVDEMVFTHPK